MRRKLRILGFGVGLLGAGIAVYAAHTNLDAAPGGLAVEAARRLGLREVRFLHPVNGTARIKVVVLAHVTIRVFPVIPGGVVKRIVIVSSGPGVVVLVAHSAAARRWRIVR